MVCDDVYDGYFIPAGSVVIGNSWCVLRLGFTRDARLHELFQGNPARRDRLPRAWPVQARALPHRRLEAEQHALPRRRIWLRQTHLPRAVHGARGGVDRGRVGPREVQHFESAR